MTELQDIIKAVKDFEEVTKRSSTGSTQWLAEVDAAAAAVTAAIVAYNTP